ncbi:MAG: HEAT repeat domain-containing protein [Proteobacteria bacterium]|jgi:hypothetical protein|nr:HEAT repeat domain-containing protein [Pseudomonadota bacterium]
MKRFLSFFVCSWMLMPFSVWAQNQEDAIHQVTSSVKEALPEGTQIQVTTDGQVFEQAQDETDNGVRQTNDEGSMRASELRRRQPRKRELKNREFDDCEKIRLLLCAHCEFPSKEDFVTTSADPESCIKGIIADETVLISVRERALTALAYFDSVENRESLKQALEDANESDDRFFVIYAIIAYSNIAEEEAVPIVEKFLQHKDEFVRLTAIRRLGMIHGKEAYQALKKQYQIEENRFFKQKIEDALAEQCKKNRSLCR